jgi:hypothetical protein
LVRAEYSGGAVLLSRVLLNINIAVRAVRVDQSDGRDPLKRLDPRYSSESVESADHAWGNVAVRSLLDKEMLVRLVFRADH